MNLGETVNPTPSPDPPDRSDSAPDTDQYGEQLLMTKVEYEVEETGYAKPMPVVHLHARNQHDEPRHVQVEGFRPYFFIEAQEFWDDPEGVLNDRRVVSVEVPCEPELAGVGESIGDVMDRYDGDTNLLHRVDPRTTLDGDPLARIVATVPEDVGSTNARRDPLRSYFETDHEADIPFERRFAIGTEIFTGFSVAKGAQRVTYENHGPREERTQELVASDPPDGVEPRLCLFDIEVATGGGGVPDPARARQPITAITAYDSLEDVYRCWALRHDDWDVPDMTIVDGITDELASFEADIDIEFDNPGGITVYSSESTLLEEFHLWCQERDFDMVSGWNSEQFDIPYLIQRSYEKSVLEVMDYPSTGNPGVWTVERNGEEIVRCSFDHASTLDMLKAYRKTQFRQLDSYALDDVAEAELGYGKFDFDADELDEAWANTPAQFFAYNVIDVEALASIEREAELVELYENLRELTGASYKICTNNGPMLDTLFLRRAADQGYALPTNEAPDVGELHGAHVFDPEPGVHPNVVYPDLASLYPYIIWSLNVSPETMYRTRDAYLADGYDDDQVFTAYVDKREFARIPKGESYTVTEDPNEVPPGEIQVDPSEQKGVLTPTGENREILEPRYDEIYFLKPNVKEGFVRSLVDKLVEFKYKYTGLLYKAVKRVVNSIFGVLGDSASGGKGFRLFDWMLGETITLGGRKVIQFTAEQYTEQIETFAERDGHPEVDVQLVGGDSVPENEPVIIRDESGQVDIVPIKQLEGRAGDVEVWSDEGFTTVKDVIKKPNRKDTYVTQTKAGVVRTTEDHGLLRDDGTEVTPTVVDQGDELLHSMIDDIDVSEQEFDTDRAWLLGLFAAEGSCGVYESEYGGKASWAINNQDRELLEKAQDILERKWGLRSEIAESMTSSNTLKLQLTGNGKVEGPVLGFREMLYDGPQKRVPRCILHADEKAKYAFLKGYHKGDGHFELKDGELKAEGKDFDQMTTKHELLASGITFLLKQLGYKITLNQRTRQTGKTGSETYYRIRVVKFHQGPDTDVRDVQQYEEDCEYVYDLETENHHFHAGVGSQIVHNTDSVMSSIRHAPDFQTALRWAQEASEAFQPTDGEPGLYDEFMEQEFGIEFGVDEHRMDVEIESLASALFFMQDDDTDPTEYVLSDSGYLVKEEGQSSGVKKRYAEHVVWDEDDGWLDTEAEDPLDEADASTIKYQGSATYEDYEDGALSGKTPGDNVSITGFEYVRSDSAEITRETQLRVLSDILLTDDPEPRIESYIRDIVDRAEAGDLSVERLARRKGISNPIDEYGWKPLDELEQSERYEVTDTDRANEGRYVTTPSPIYRGAKYADDHFQWEDLGPGSKPKKIPIDTVRTDDYPAAYEYETYPLDDRPDPPEIESPVDAVAMETPERLPDGFLVDYETLVRKNVREKLEPILATIDIDWDELLADSEQASLGSWT
jgi:DNA polymerase elongation subunit (family B)